MPESPDQRGANIRHDATRRHREAVVRRAPRGVLVGDLLDLHHIGVVPARCLEHGLLDPPDAVGDVAHHFELGEVDRVDLGGEKIDVNDRSSAPAHEERRLLDHIVADVDDQVRIVDGPMDEVVRGKSGVADEERVSLVQHALAHGRTHRSTDPWRATHRLPR